MVNGWGVPGHFRTKAGACMLWLGRVVQAARNGVSSIIEFVPDGNPPNAAGCSRFRAGKMNVHSGHYRPITMRPGPLNPLLREVDSFQDAMSKAARTLPCQCGDGNRFAPRIFSTRLLAVLVLVPLHIAFVLLLDERSTGRGNLIADIVEAFHLATTALVHIETMFFKILTAHLHFRVVFPGVGRCPDERCEYDQKQFVHGNLRPKSMLQRNESAKYSSVKHAPTAAIIPQPYTPGATREKHISGAVRIVHCMRCRGEFKDKCEPEPFNSSARPAGVKRAMGFAGREYNSPAAVINLSLALGWLRLPLMTIRRRRS